MPIRTTGATNTEQPHKIVADNKLQRQKTRDERIKPIKTSETSEIGQTKLQNFGDLFEVFFVDTQTYHFGL